MSTLKLKVCGMRNPENIQDVLKVGPDFIGFIFYAASSRYAADLDEGLLLQIPENIHKVGVFVNETIDQVCTLVVKFKLDYVQLHGDEDVAYVEALRSEGVKVIKVFRVLDQLPDGIQDFEGLVDFILFDTSTATYGGSGKQFDWDILKQVELSVPFLLSGGICLEDLNRIKSLEIPMLYGIDVNSRFELEPGLKDVERVRELKMQL